MASKLTIQVVGWNSAPVLPETLAALSTIPRDRVIIRYIDNASQDTSVALVKKILPQAQIIQLDKNKGFAGAHNAGLAQCDTSLVMTCDPDLKLIWSGVKKLLEKFDDTKVGAVQGKIYRAKGREIDSAGIVQTLALNGKERGASKEDRGQYEKETRLLAVTGACGIYRMEALRKVSHSSTEFFDSDFFAYKEDVDLGWRLNKRGWKVLYEPVLTGRHRRTLGKRGWLGWGLSPKTIYQRLRSPRTRFSLRNWVWMIVKNVSIGQGLLHEVFIGARLLVFLLLNLAYPPLFGVWGEILRGLPHMLDKRV
ncbi:MAG: glycosyltransferase family 2 protein [bacterium]